MSVLYDNGIYMFTYYNCLCMHILNLSFLDFKIQRRKYEKIHLRICMYVLCRKINEIFILNVTPFIDICNKHIMQCIHIRVGGH